MKSRSAEGGLVYSTDAGRMCPACRQPVASCVCHRAPTTSARPDGTLRVAVETKGRHGKAVTVVRGVPLDAAPLAELGKSLRTACGCGGTTKDGAIELQGDHTARAIEALRQAGWTVKQAGGR